MVTHTMLVSFILTTISGIRLYLNQPLESAFVSQELKIYTISLSSIITFIIIPYYYKKCKDIVGFKTVDYVAVYRKKAPVELKYAHKNISKTPLFLLFLIFCFFFFWIPMERILIYYNSMNDMFSIILFLFFYGCFVQSFIHPQLLQGILVYIQHTYYSEHITSSNANNEE